MEDFKTFLAWRKQAKFEGLWERTRGMYLAQPLTIEVVDMPWGQIPRVSTFGGERALCGAEVRNGQRAGWGRCERVAGAGTSHLGAGWCNLHLGNSRPGNLEGFLIMAHGFAESFEITPAAALQGELERTEGGVRWLDKKVGEAQTDFDLLDDDLLGGFVALREKERTHLVKVALACVNAGVTEMLGQQIRVEGEQIAAIMNKALSALGLEADQEDRMRQILAKDLLAIGAVDPAKTSPPSSLTVNDEEG